MWPTEKEAIAALGPGQNYLIKVDCILDFFFYSPEESRGQARDVRSDRGEK
jgi:hypothetical protein